MKVLNKIIHWKTVLLYGFFMGQLFFSVTLLHAQDTEHSAVDPDNTSEIPASSLKVANNTDNEYTEHSSKKEKRNMYIGFVYPLGSNWVYSIKYRYIFSLSLLGNVTGGTAGVAFSPLFNAALGNSYGLHMAALANVTVGDFIGFQSAALANVTVGDFIGFQSAALANVTGGDFTGFQSAALANITTGKLKGVSLGIINIITKNSPDAFPIGLLNVVVGGRFQLGIAASTVFPSGALVYRMGAKHVYTIYSAAPSVSYANNGFSYTGYAGGLGIGFDIPIHTRMALLVEIEGISLNTFSSPPKGSTNLLTKISVVTQIRPLIEFRIVKNMSLIVGPTINFYFKNKSSNYKPLWDMPINGNEYITFGAGGYVSLVYTF